MINSFPHLDNILCYTFRKGVSCDGIWRIENSHRNNRKHPHNLHIFILNCSHWMMTWKIEGDTLKMKTLKQNWWKLIIITLVTLIVRVLLLELLPLRTSTTFEFELSVLSQNIGMIPTAAIVIALSYLMIASVLIIVQEGLPGSKSLHHPSNTLWLFPCIHLHIPAKQNGCLGHIK